MIGTWMPPPVSWPQLVCLTARRPNCQCSRRRGRLTSPRCPARTRCAMSPTGPFGLQRHCTGSAGPARPDAPAKPRAHRAGRHAGLHATRITIRAPDDRPAGGDPQTGGTLIDRRAEQEIGVRGFAVAVPDDAGLAGHLHLRSAGRDGTDDARPHRPGAQAHRPARVRTIAAEARAEP